jgi:hypothetical protein
MSIARFSLPKQVSFSSVFLLQQFDHDGLIHEVSSKQLMLRCLLLELCETFVWAAISEAVNTNELILCSRGNSGSSCGYIYSHAFSEDES